MSGLGPTGSESADGKVSKYGASCTNCRRRKQRCDGQTPTCGRCGKSGEACLYEGNARRLTTSQLYAIHHATNRFLRSLTVSTASADELRAQVAAWLDQGNDVIQEDETSPVLADIMAGQSRLSSERRESVQAPNRVPVAARQPAGETSDAAGDIAQAGGDQEGEESGAAEVDELLMQMSINQEGQNGHFGVTSFLWQTPSQDVLDRLQSRALESEQNSGDRKGPGSGRRSMSAISARSAGSPSNPLPATAKREKDEAGEIWITEVTEAEQNEASELGLLRANASMLGNWESLAFHRLELEHNHESATSIIHLLKTYFSWQYGQHCVVYRPVFLRDMALGGPYFNKFLLNVICTSAARFSDRHIPADWRPSAEDQRSGTKTPGRLMGAEYLAEAKLHLMHEMDKPSSIPTIQGLLLLGQRECSCGNLSQGWQYTGMAFRAMRDLGIHLNVSRLPIFGFGTLTHEDREIRRRVFWSAYTWDKIISLALGRYPTFNAFQNVSPGPIVDDTEDDDDWYPHVWDPSKAGMLANYPVHKALTTTNNKHFIKLSEIIQKIIGRYYNGKPRITQGIPFLDHFKNRLESWYNGLPASMALDPKSLPEHCPPPHIFSTHALYRATWILLYRMFLPNDLPFQTSPPAHIAVEASRVCTAMAEELHVLFQLYNKSFQLRNMTYTTSWSMYSAATINAMDFHSPDPVVAAKASPRLMFSLHVLEKACIAAPGIERSIDLIKQRLRAPRPRLVKRSNTDQATPSVRDHKRLTQVAESQGSSEASGSSQISPTAKTVNWEYNPVTQQHHAPEPPTGYMPPPTGNMSDFLPAGSASSNVNFAYPEASGSMAAIPPDLAQFFAGFGNQDHSGAMQQQGEALAEADMLANMAAMPITGVGDAAWATNDWFEALWRN